MVSTDIILIFEIIKKYFLTALDFMQPWLQTFQQKALVLYDILASKHLLLGLIGVLVALGPINWCIWGIRRFRSIFYHPFRGEYTTTTSVIIPVYMEKKQTLKKVIDSILKNNPDEILVIVDQSETELLSFLQEYHQITVHVIEEPGKRPALAKGIRLAKHEIVVLVDSDTIWEGDDFLQQLLLPFQDPKVAGVGSRQKVANKKTWGQKIIDWNLNLKYLDYLPSDSLAGSVLCLSGRTAAYRKKVILHDLNKLTHEYFLGHHCLGGDDTRLTSLVLMKGYRTVYQNTAIAKTDFDHSFFIYLKQKVRWSRNSFRAYLRAICSTWPWRQRRWYYLMAAYHTIFPGIASLVGVFFFLYALYLQEYLLVYLWLAWIVISRTIKSISHLKNNLGDIYLIPVVVAYYYFLSFIKVYALLTMTREKWAGSREEYTIRGGKRVETKSSS